MTQGLTITSAVHFRHGRGRRKVLERGESPAATVEPGRIPRVSRLMALALRLQRLVQSGEVADYADLARLGHVTRARVTQIMNLLNLAPDIQEELLFLPRSVKGRDPIRERHLRPIAAVLDWRKQRRMWRQLLPERQAVTRCFSRHSGQLDSVLGGPAEVPEYPANFVGRVSDPGFDIRR